MLRGFYALEQTRTVFFDPVRGRGDQHRRRGACWSRATAAEHTSPALVARLRRVVPGRRGDLATPCCGGRSAACAPPTLVRFAGPAGHRRGRLDRGGRRPSRSSLHRPRRTEPSLVVAARWRRASSRRRRGRLPAARPAAADRARSPTVVDTFTRRARAPPSAPERGPTMATVAPQSDREGDEGS